MTTLPLDDLVDHHCHGILTADLDREAFEGLMNEAVRAAPLGTTLFDSSLGWAIRRHCAPLLDLEPRAQRPDLAVIHFDNCLQIIELDDAIPRAAAELQRDIGLQSRE